PSPARKSDQEAWAWLQMLKSMGAARRRWLISADHAAATIGETGALPDPYATDPGRLFLDIHEQWVENGGRVAGKRRNSVRNLMDMLTAAGTPVPSLRSKLKGETRLKGAEAAVLLGTYFSNWRFEAAEGSMGCYVPFQSKQLSDLGNVIQQPLFGGQPAVLLPRTEKDQKSGVKRQSAEIDEPGVYLASSEFLPESFRSSRAFVHVSRIGSVAGPTTSAAIRGFFEIIDEYWKIDLEDDLDRHLIWVVDPGDRDINNDDSLAAFTNAEQLATFFRALRLSSDSDAAARWHWLSSHAVVLVGSMDRSVTDRLYASCVEGPEAMAADIDIVRRSVKHNHFLLDASPPSWLRSSQFAKLYGQDLENLESSSFLLCLDDAETHWSYFGYAPVDPPILTEDGRKSFARFLELGSPGPAFDRVASIVHAAACFRLGSASSLDGDAERLRSILLLRHLDFAVFRLSEFLNAETLSRSPP
ncbi:MAG: hypothetical protein ACR2RA_22905, partial [Geminicoccaceae bacterium]